MEESSETHHEKGKEPDLSMVGKTIVNLNSIENEYDEPLSESRKLRNTRYSIIKERNEFENLIKNKPKSKNNYFSSFSGIIGRILFKYKFEKILVQIKKDEKVIERGVFQVSLIEYTKCVERRKKNINWIYSKRNLIKNYYPNEFIMKLVRWLEFVDSLEWYN